MTDRQNWEHGEPSVAELLSDPIVDFVLRHDGLTRGDVWRAVAAARRALGESYEPPSAAA